MCFLLFDIGPPCCVFRNAAHWTKELTFAPLSCEAVTSLILNDLDTVYIYEPNKHCTRRRKVSDFTRFTIQAIRCCFRVLSAPGRPKTDSHLNEASNEYSEEEIKAFGQF